MRRSPGPCRAACRRPRWPSGATCRARSARPCAPAGAGTRASRAARRSAAPRTASTARLAERIVGLRPGHRCRLRLRLQCSVPSCRGWSASAIRRERCAGDSASVCRAQYSGRMDREDLLRGARAARPGRSAADARRRAGRLRVRWPDGLPRAASCAWCSPSRPTRSSTTVRACHAARVPFMARGSGTSLSGGAVPIEDGIVIALNRMNRVLRFDPDARDSPSSNPAS